MIDNIHFYQIGGVTIHVMSDLPITDKTFDKKFEIFRVDKPGDDIIHLHHHFELPDLKTIKLGSKRYEKTPWRIYEQPDGWLYVGIFSDQGNQKYWKIAKFTKDHSFGHIYHPSPKSWERGKLKALTTFPTDQILLAPALSARKGFYLHSAGAILNGSGVLFVGHSEAGKSTTTQMLLDAWKTNPQDYDVEILCDDRNIVRKKDDGWWVYGSWSHGDISIVSAASARLRGICFLEKANANELIPLDDTFEIYYQLLKCMIRSFETADWWQKTLSLIEDISISIPCYRMRFDKGGDILKELLKNVV